MEYQEIVEIIQNKKRFGKAYGCEVTAEMMTLLGHPESDMHIIHIAGTNGKGSTAAFVSSILQAADFCVGRFTSPHLVRFTERIVVDDIEIEKEDVVRLGEKILSLPMKLEPTMFDVCLGIAILYFKEKNCDYIVLETGLGGAKDSTAGLSVVPEVCAFTNIGYDHTAILGNTLEEIAAEKAGILKRGTSAVIGIMDPAARNVIEKTAQKLDIPYKNVEKVSTYEISLIGGFQRENAALAMGVIETLINKKCGYLEDNFGDKKELDLKRVLSLGFKNATWPGRMEVVSKDPFILMDGAHNPQGVEALFNSLKECYPQEKFVFFVGVMADKDYHKMMRQMYPLADCFFCTRVDYARSLPAEDLRDEILSDGKTAFSCENLEDGYARAIAYARENNKKLVLFGSLYFVGKIKEKERVIK